MTHSKIDLNLSHSHLENNLTRQELDLLYSHNNMMNFSPDSIILKQGKQSQGIYLILEGSVIVSAKILGEGTTNLETLEPGNFFGEISFMEKGPCATSVIAKTNVTCLLLNSVYFEMLSAYFPETQYKLFNTIIKQVCDRLKKMHDKVVLVISQAEMLPQPLFGKILHSLQRPDEITFEKAEIDIFQLQKCSDFDKDEITALVSQGVLLVAPKNCTLIHQGQKDASCYIVLCGAVQSSIMYENKAAKLSVIGPTTLFAGIACVDHDPSFTITFATCEKAILFKLTEEALSYFQKNNPTLWYKLFNLICQSLVALEKSVDKLDIRLNIETYNR